MLNIALMGLLLTLAPYTGAPLPGAVTSTAKFALRVSGEPRQVVHLRVVGLPPGYIASFCTDRVCAPFQVALSLPASGRQQIEVALIENTTGAKPPRSVTVRATGGATASIAFSRATH